MSACIEEERRERKALEERLRALERNQSLPVSSSSSVAPLQFSNALSQQAAFPQVAVATSSQSLTGGGSNHAVEQYNLGEMYRQGQGVAKDYTKACEWYEKAAAQGYAGAQCCLGWMYHQGQGVAKDYTKAREWYEKAAAQGHIGAIEALQALNESSEPRSSAGRRP